jgi:glucose/arabinose dehydrogenase
MKKTLLFIAALFAFTSVFSQTYTSTTIVSGLSNPVAFDVASDGRFFITQKGGVSGMATNAFIKVYSSTGTFLSNFYNLTDSCNSDFERGLLGIELDPDFDNNRYVYAYYNHNFNGDERIRIVRFTEASNVGTNPTLIFDLDVSNSIAGNHVGGNLHFRPSEPNQIYLTIGDLAYQQGNATLNYANKKTNPYGKVLRINKDGSVPTDNPYYDDGNPLATNCDWIWSYGHRNPFDFCFSPVSDSMYVSENGWNAWDETNIIHRGAFYGWANCEGNYANSSTTTLCTTPNAVAPIGSWGTPLPAITGILYYSSPVWPALDNHLIVADNDYGRVYDCTLGNAPAYDVVTSRTTLGDLTTSGGLTTLQQSADGCIFAMKGGYTSSGAIYKVCPLGIGLKENGSILASLNAFPNPTSTNFSLEFYLSESREITAEMTDITGRVVMTKNMNAVIGTNTLQFDLKQKSIEGGIYFVRLVDTKANQNLGNTKIIIE